MRPLQAADVPLLHHWFYQPDVIRWLQLSEDAPEYRTLAAVQERFERLDADPHTHVWRIDAADGTPIGQIELTEIHPLQRRAEMHMLIGADGVRSRGYGSEAVRVLLDHAFRNLQLRRVTLIVDADNPRAMRCFEKAGFVREGLLRQHRLRHGEPVDMMIMGALADDTR